MNKRNGSRQRTQATEKPKQQSLKLTGNKNHKPHMQLTANRVPLSLPLEDPEPINAVIDRETQKIFSDITSILDHPQGKKISKTDVRRLNDTIFHSMKEVQKHCSKIRENEVILHLILEKLHPDSQKIPLDQMPQLLLVYFQNQRYS